MPEHEFRLFAPDFFLRDLLDLHWFSRRRLPNAHHLCRPLESGLPTLPPDLELPTAGVLEGFEHINHVASGHHGPSRLHVRLDAPDGCPAPVPLATGEVIEYRTSLLA